MEQLKHPYNRKLHKEGEKKTKAAAKIAAVKAFVTGNQRRKSHPNPTRVPRDVHNSSSSLDSLRITRKGKAPVNNKPLYPDPFPKNRSLDSMGRHSLEYFRDAPVEPQNVDSARDAKSLNSLDWGLTTTHDHRSELARIESYVEAAKTKLPELQSPKDESVEDSVIRIIQTYQRISESLRDSRGRLEPVDKIKENYQRSQDELELAKRTALEWNDHCQTEKRRYEAEINNLKGLVSTLEMASSGAVKSRTDQLSLQREKEEIEMRYKDLLKRAHDDAATQITSLQRDKNALYEELRATQHDNQQRLRAERTEHEAQIRDLNSKFGDRVKETSEMFERRLQHEKTENEARMTETEAKNMLIKQQTEEIKRAHETQTSSLHSQWKAHLETVLAARERQLKEEEVRSLGLVEKKHEQLKQEMSQLQMRLAEEHKIQESIVQELQAKHNDESDHQKMELEARMRRESKKNEDVVRKLTSQHKAELDRQSADADLRSKKQQKRYEAEVREMKAMIIELAELKKEVGQQIPRLQIDVPALETQLGDPSGADIRQVRAAAEDLRTALLNPSHHVLKDRQIVARFRAIATEIERLARIEWDSRRTARWPCSEENLHRLNRENTRKLKQYMIQSSLWIFLYERIFRSPFCMFGPEGAEMDRDWEDIYSPNVSPSKWPDVSLAVEDKRCANAKRCLTIIEPSTEAAPDDVKLKNSYELVIATAVEAFSKLMENINSFGESGRKIVTTIVRLCAKVWLECCSQQYRLMVRIGSTSGNVLNLNSREAPILALLRVPELRRYGTLQGIDLKKEESIVGWKGVVTVFPATH